MGNCVVLLRPNRRISWETQQYEKILRIVKTDGKVLEYRASVLVGDLLSSFAGYGVGVSQKAWKHLPSDHELLTGRVYHLLPLDAPIGGSVGASPAPEEEPEAGGCKKVKVVLTKQQLQELLSNRLSLEELLSGLSTREEQDKFDSSTSWRPHLETILEGNEWRELEAEEKVSIS